MTLDFNKLASKVRSVDPYRGTMRYPMENRSNRQNIFELVETNNDIEFHISHGYRYTEKEISEARFKLLDGVRGARVHKKTHDHESYEYYTHESVPRVLCVVRSDNTLEYVANSYYQGDNMKMSDWMGGYQHDTYRMSGTAYTSGYYNKHDKGVCHPIFKGLRINQETHEPVGMNVQVFRRTVNRKKSKELMAKYKEAFKSPDAMLKCMDTDTMIVSIKDILDEHFGHDGNTYINTKKCFEIAERMFAEGSNFDGVILHGFAQGIQGFNRWAIDSFSSGQNRNYYRMTEPKNVVPRLISCMAKKLYKEYKPFDEEEVDFKNVKGSEWGIRIVVDGVELES
jgi:hypothetical protein